MSDTTDNEIIRREEAAHLDRLAREAEGSGAPRLAAFLREERDRALAIAVEARLAPDEGSTSSPFVYAMQ